MGQTKSVCPMKGEYRGTRICLEDDMMCKVRRIALLVLAVQFIMLYMSVAVAATEDTTSPAATDAETGGFLSYADYIGRYADVSRQAESFSVNGAGYISVTGEAEALESFEGNPAPSLRVSESGSVTYEVSVPADGLYNIGLYYYPIQGKGGDIERTLYIDGSLPFDEASGFSFSRIWKNAVDTIETNSRGNDVYPQQEEAPEWRFEAFDDYRGFHEDAFEFFLSAGTHQITLEAVKEPVVIGEIRFYRAQAPKPYAQVKAEYDKNGYSAVAGDVELFYEAQLADAKSSPTLSPAYDRSSPLVTPSSPSKLKLNILGGGRWNKAGQWVEYTVDVKQAGLYSLTFKIRQNSARGLIVSRRLYIDGEVPFEEALRLEYSYHSKWRMETVSAGEEPCYIYLSEGRHTVKLEAVLGEMGEFCSEAAQSVTRLNEAYRRIVMVTGPSPDTYRDYSLDKALPDITELFLKESENLSALSARLQSFTGERSSHTAFLDTFAFQLKDIGTHHDKIPKKLGAFRDNISALGTWVLNVKQTSLDLDFFILSGDGYELPRANAGFFQGFLFNMQSFFASFTQDYSTIGDTASDSAAASITVWINSGRDQAQIIKNIIDVSFLPESNIDVDLKLVQGALLQATVAGRGPDVALTVGQGDPVNYAVRGAALDLSRFADFEKTAGVFAENAMAPMRFNGGVYGLPESVTFPMLFYRSDILRGLGLSVPKTWTDVYEALIVLNRNNMQFGVPGLEGGSSSFGMFLYQNGGKIYNEDGSRALLDSEEAIAAMRGWAELYTDHRLPLSFDFANRFRSGEMPIGIADYTAYNMLTAFAPEIRGQWSFTLVPGTVQSDGSVDHTAISNVLPCMIMGGTKKPEASWEFVKWWVSGEIQLEFGRQIESLMGEVARYSSANPQALERMSWPAQDYKKLMEQYRYVRGVPEVPGGYFLWRHVDNAFRTVVDNGIDAREVMLDYNLIINKEIAVKREEFGLSLLQ